MKRCPECGRTYADDTIAFCLADGALLSAPYDSEPTLRFPPLKPTEPSLGPDDLRRAVASPRPKNRTALYVALLVIAMVVVGTVAIWLILDRQRNSKRELAAAASDTATPNSVPSPAPTASLSSEKPSPGAEKPSPKPQTSPTSDKPADLSYLTGEYDLYRLENPAGGVIRRMTLRVRKGNEIFVRGTDWTGTGKIDGKQGYYDWKFEDGKFGRTTVLVNDNGTMQGRVFGSGIDWWYLARRQK
jgi:hypothetical protein